MKTRTLLLAALASAIVGILTHNTGAEAQPTQPQNDIASYTSIRQPTQRTRWTDGSTTILATSFCNEQIGRGVELLVQGFPSRSVITATINNNATQLVETRPGIFTQIFSSKAPSYQVILSTPDGARTTMNLAGCP